MKKQTRQFDASGKPEPCRHVNPISGNRWDKVFVPDCKINFCPNCGVKLEEA